jgi:DNA-binding LacI/PurR family transcriptional regulator
LGRASAVDLIAVSLSPEQSVGLHPYYSRVLAATVAALQRESVQLHVQVIAEDVAAERIDTIAGEATAGAILVNVGPELALRFYGRCSRVVSLIPTAADVPAVEADNEGGARNAVNHLYTLGRRRIAAIHGPVRDTRAIGRRAGYRRATQILALSDIGAEGGFTREGGYLAAVRLLDEHPDIDAIFAACDLTAAGAIQAVIATGRRVPHDVSVVGFDDSLVAVCNSPTLTTMRQPIEEMATAAIRLLLTGRPGAGHREIFPVELVERDSTLRCSDRRMLVPVGAGFGL